jgi:hypothetical protein
MDLRGRARFACDAVPSAICPQGDEDLHLHRLQLRATFAGVHAVDTDWLPGARAALKEGGEYCQVLPCNPVPVCSKHHDDAEVCLGGLPASKLARGPCMGAMRGEGPGPH